MATAKNPNIVAKHQREGDDKMLEGEKWYWQIYFFFLD